MSAVNTSDESGTLFINIGTVKACLFVRMSSFLLRRLEQYPVLYYAVEEALECAKIGYFGIGIIAFAQLLNQLSEETPDSRHLVAHKFLELRPSKEAFDDVVAKFKCAAAERSDLEIRKCASCSDYERKVSAEWQDFIKKLHPSSQLPRAN